MDDRPDAALVGDALNGQREAFCALVRRYQDYAYGLAIGKLSDFDLARDVVQEAFLHAYRDLSKLRDPERFGGWLHGIVRNVAYRTVRDLRRFGDIAQDLCRAAQPYARTPAPDESAESGERRDLVRQALDELGEANREAVSLYYVDGFSYGDIATFLDVPRSTVKGRVQRGRSQLREDLAMVEETFREQQLPEDFAAEVRRLLEHAAPRGEEREPALKRIAQIGKPAVQPLCEALKGTAHTVQRLAARALCAIGDRSAIEPMLRWADPWHNVFRNGSVLRIDGMREALLAIVRCERDGNLDAAISSLGYARGDGEAYESILSIFRSTDPALGNARHMAMASLCEIRPETATEIAGEALSGPDLDLRRRACIYARWLNPAVLPPLAACMKALGRSCMPVGELAMRHGEQGRVALEQALRKGSDDRRIAAAMALARTGMDEVFDVLKQEFLAAAQGSKWHRELSFTLARWYGAKLVKWAVAEGDRLLDNPSVAWALTRSRPEAGLTIVEELFRKGTPSVRRAALRMLARQKGANLLPELRQCLRVGQPGKVAQEAFRQMLRLRDAALPTAEEMFESEHWTERKAATCLLKQWGKLTQEQHARAKEDPHVAVRHAAVLPFENPELVEFGKWHPKWHKRVEGMKPKD